MREVVANLWTFPAYARVITTNGFVKNNGNAVMGRGCAREAALKYPYLPKWLGAMIRMHGNHVFVRWPDNEPDTLVTFPVKDNWWEAAKPALIISSAQELVAIADQQPAFKHGVVMPRPGCGNGKLNWNDVRPLISGILDDRFTVVSL